MSTSWFMIYIDNCQKFRLVIGFRCFLSITGIVKKFESHVHFVKHYKSENLNIATNILIKITSIALIKP